MKKTEVVRGQALPKDSDKGLRDHPLLGLSQIHKPHVIFSHHETLSTSYH